MNIRHNYLDSVSGFFIIHMILTHVFALAGNYHVYRPFCTIFFFFMPWFYFKAGLFINRNRDLKTWVKRDFMRLLVPFIAFTIIGSVFYYAMELYTPDKPVWKVLIMPIYQVIKEGSAYANKPLWFLLSLFLTRLAYRLIPEKFQPYSVVVALFGGMALSHWDIRLPLTLSTVFPGFFFLMMGRYSRPYIVPEGLTSVNRGGQIVAIILYLIVLMFFNVGNDMRVNTVKGYYLVWILGSFCGCITMTFLFNSFLGKIGFLSFIGRHSMMYYVVHCIPLYVTRFIITKLYPDINPVTLSLIMIVILTLTLLIVTWQRKRIPPVLLGE